MTGAFLPAATLALQSSLTHEVSATAVPVTGSPVALDLEDISVTFAEDWSPHVQVSLVVPALEDEALYDLLDPLKRCKIQIATGYTYDNNVRDVHDLATVYLIRRGVKRPDNSVALEAASAEALAQTARLNPWASWVPVRTGLNEWVTWLATYAEYPAVPVIVTTFAAGYSAADLVDIPVEAGMDCWSLIAEAASRTGAWVYVDGYGRWIITGRPTDTGTVSHTVATGPTGTVFDSDAQLAREGFANSCLITYKWKSGTTDMLRSGFAEVNSGALAPASAGRMGDATERPGPISQAAANKAAASRLANLATRGRSLLLEAHAAYWLRPSQTILAQLRTGPAERVLVRAVAYHPLAGTMNVTTRQADNVPMKIGE